MDGPEDYAEASQQQRQHLDAVFARNPWLRPTTTTTDGKQEPKKQSWAERNKSKFACQRPQGGTNHNERVTKVLFRLAEAYEICGDTWRHYAYKKGAMALQHHPCAVMSKCVRLRLFARVCVGYLVGCDVDQLVFVMKS